MTILLDIDPALAAERKSTGRDRYERDLALLERVRDSYTRQAAQEDWVSVNGDQTKDAVTAEIMSIVSARLSPA